MGFQLNFNTVSFVLLLASLVLVILSTISAPVVTSFGLGETSDHIFGIFGYCKSDGSDCISATYPYLVGNIDSDAGWKLSSSTRNTLAKIFIVCPIAAGINFICWIMIIVSHFFTFKMLLVSIIFNILSFVVTTLVAVIVVLVFLPNVHWTGWILIGAAAANLISLVFLILTLKFKDGSKVEYDPAAGNEVQDLSAFDEKFNHTSAFAGPYNKISNFNPNDTNSSMSKDFAYKVDHNNTSLMKSFSESSIYNSNPQIANDITAHDKSARTNQKDNFVRDGEVNLVNGPNTPVSSNKQMAPNIVPTTVTPTLNDAPSSMVPQLPYPRNSMNNMKANTINKSVFEHHPEVEGHKPFTELYDDEDDVQRDADSDLDSDFTSVSQRAPNPNYPIPNNYQPNANGYQNNVQFPQGNGYQPQNFTGNYQPSNYPPGPPQNQNFQQSNTSYQPGGFQPQPRPQPSQGPNMQASYGAHYNQPQPKNLAGFSPQQQRFAPTISDNVLANNPDFAFGGPARRKNNQFIPPAKRNLGNLQSSLHNSRLGPYGAI